jgi:hypothetical protein
MKKLWSVVLGTAFLAGIVGCRNLARPSVLHSGSAPQQQRRAQEFDPYPENDAGPTVLGSRPLGYKHPRSEVDRAQHDLQWLSR